MVFSVNHESKKMLAAIQSEGGTERYECIATACDNPVCTCGSVYLELIPRPGEISDDRPLVPHKVSIDIVSRTLEHKGTGKTPTDDLDFAGLFLSQLDEDDYRFLYARMFQFKHEITENSSVDSIDAYFDYGKIERDGLMSAYNDVLPYADQLFVTIGDTQYLVYDQFCLLPKCPCSDATLVIISIDSVGKPGGELCAISLDYRKRKWKGVESFLSSFPTETLRSAIEAQIPDIYEKLLARHIRIKAIYAHCKKKHFKLQAPPELPKVGRNDPCPCGSGKKNKKCCLGKQQSKPE
jgi:hypothetical protein